MGGLVGVVLIAVVVIVIVIILKNKQDSSQHGKVYLTLPILYNNLLLSLQLVEEEQIYHVRTTWCTVCVR